MGSYQDLKALTQPDDVIRGGLGDGPELEKLNEVYQRLNAIFDLTEKSR